LSERTDPNACDLCEGTHFDVVSNTDRHGEPLTTGICTRCGLITHLPVPDETEVAEYYATRYRRDYHGERMPSDRRVMRAWNNAARIHRQLGPQLAPGSRVFEIGAGIGCTVKTFARQGFTASGIEPNTDFNRYTRERLHADVQNRNLFDLEPAPRYDAVLLIHVIEHFTSPSRALSHIYKLLADGGLLYIECPNVVAPFATFGRLFHYAHIYNFAPETLEQLAAKCGFMLVERITGDAHPDIRMLFRKSLPAEPVIPEGQAERILQAVRRFGSVGYHLRPVYLGRRLTKLAGYAWEYLYAPWFVRRLLARMRP
jgi:2-polyprenyl-3-methyl-5-hydroxy-6-metoxy-1,4-benzoquinol methylase